MLMEFKGNLGKIELYKDKIVIKRGIWHKAGRSEKEIYLSSITAIQIKKPGLTAGYIQFVLSGSQEIKSGDIMKMAEDENSVIFNGKPKYEEAIALKKKIEQLKQQSSQPQTIVNSSVSVADELTKLKGLLDSGILTEQEFMQEKARLLNR